MTKNWRKFSFQIFTTNDARRDRSYLALQLTPLPPKGAPAAVHNNYSKPLIYRTVNKSPGLKIIIFGLIRTDANRQGPRRSAGTFQELGRTYVCQDTAISPGCRFPRLSEITIPMTQKTVKRAKA
jgi:hypothetical protein